MSIKKQKQKTKVFLISHPCLRKNLRTEFCIWTQKILGLTLVSKGSLLLVLGLFHFVTAEVLPPFHLYCGREMGKYSRRSIQCFIVICFVLTIRYRRKLFATPCKATPLIIIVLWIKIKENLQIPQSKLSSFVNLLVIPKHLLKENIFPACLSFFSF